MKFWVGNSHVRTWRRRQKTLQCLLICMGILLLLAQHCALVVGLTPDTSPTPEISAFSAPPSSNFESPPFPAPTPASASSPNSPRPRLASPSDLYSPPAPPPANGGFGPSPQTGPSPYTEEEADKHSDGISRGKKAGVAFAIIISVAIVGLAALVWKKRRDNIRKARYNWVTRSET